MLGIVGGRVQKLYQRQTKKELERQRSENVTFQSKSSLTVDMSIEMSHFCFKI